MSRSLISARKGYIDLLVFHRFLLARLFLQSLRYKTSPQRLIDAVENLPSSIYQQYKERLERVEQQKFDHSELARRILGWLTHAHRPMKVEELRHALAVKQGDKAINTQNLDMEDLFVPCCQGLVSIEKETQIIRLVHHTAQQYLDGNRLNIFPEMQAQILGTCLTYLSFSQIRRGRCSFESFGEYGEVNKVANGKRIAKWRFLPNRLSDFPFLHYAASNWGWHAAGEVGSSHVNEIITFLQSPMLLESAAQVQDCDMWPISEGSTNRVRTHLPLWVSGSFGLDSIASILLANTEAINVNERYGLEQNILLEQAVEAGNLGLVRVLLHAGADIKLPRPELNTISRAERPILYTAIAHGHDAIVEALLLQRPFMQIEESVFYCAAFREREAIIRSILDHSNDDSERVDRAHQILFHAACLGKLSAIELALQLGASVSTKNTNGQTALFVAVEHGRYDAVEKLLSAGSITTERDASSKSLLQVAVGTHRIIQERLRCIEDYGCNYEGIPGLSIGPCSLSEPIIPDAWLLAKLDTWFEDCTAKELIKSIAFKRDVVYEDSEHTKVMKRILACQGNVNEKNSEGQSLLHLAVCSTLERARTFIQVSGNALIIDERDNNGRTPLHYAAARGKAAIMKLLLDHGARIDLVDNDDATTLHFSIMSPACTKLTLERGNLIHAQDKLCRTALHYTALLEEPNLKVRDMLLAGGVRPGTVDIYRQTAQYYYDTHSDGHFESHKGGQFLGHMMYQCSTELANRALYSAIDNCQYYHQRYSVRFHMQIQENAIASAKREKRWTIVSDSEDEDFGK